MGVLYVRFDKDGLITFFEGKISELPGQAETLVGNISTIYQLVTGVCSPVISGFLSDSIIQVVTGLEGEIYPTAFYADWVINGRGDVYPVNKLALWWPGLDHPVKHAKPSQPNDFMLTGFLAANDGGEISTLCSNLLEWMVSS